MIEHEVKLAFESASAARQAVTAAGGHPVRARRLLSDVLFDSADGALRASGTTVRLRRDGDRAILTVKGPVHDSTVKSREELEVTVSDASVMDTMLARLGFRPGFRAEKYRETFLVDRATVTVDETPCGVFVEVEAASPEAVDAVSAALGRSPADYRLESYPALWRRWCDSRGWPPGDMVFDAHPS
jgi:adenylate cyclase class 2